MTDFTRAEINRLLDTLRKTDPTSSEYSRLLQNIEYFVGIGGTIEAFTSGSDMSFCDSVTPCEQLCPQEEEHNFQGKLVEPSGEATVEDSTSDLATDDDSSDSEYTEEEVRQALIELRKAKRINIASLIADNFGVNSFNALPAKKYGELMKLISKMAE